MLMLLSDARNKLLMTIYRLQGRRGNEHGLTIQTGQSARGSQEPSIWLPAVGLFRRGGMGDASDQSVGDMDGNKTRGAGRDLRVRVCTPGQRWCRRRPRHVTASTTVPVRPPGASGERRQEATHAMRRHNHNGEEIFSASYFQIPRDATA